MQYTALPENWVRLSQEEGPFLGICEKYNGDVDSVLYTTDIPVVALRRLVLRCEAKINGREIF